MKTAIQSMIDDSIAVKKNLGSEQIAQIADVLISCYKNKKKILICGNGGSACDSMHFAEELVARYKMNRPALPALALTDPATITCAGNDFGFATIFSRQVEAHGQEGDILFALSTSGNSENVVKAAEAAKKKNMTVIGLLGGDGGKVKALCDRSIVIPSNSSARIQESHITIIHCLCDVLEKALFENA